MTQNDPLKQLQEAGIPVEKLSDQQREVLTDLSPEEVSTIIRVNERLSAATDDEVQGYAMGSGGPVTGYVFY